MSTVNNLGVVGKGFKCGNVRSLLNLLEKRLATDCPLSVKYDSATYKVTAIVKICLRHSFMLLIY